MKKLLAAHDLEQLNIRRAEAWAALHPFLNRVILPAGVVSMRKTFRRRMLYCSHPRQASSSAMISTRQSSTFFMDLLEEKVVRLRLPAPFEPLVYDVRLHIGAVRERLERS